MNAADLRRKHFHARNGKRLPASTHTSRCCIGREPDRSSGVQCFWLPKRASPRMRVVPRRQHRPLRVRSAHPPSAAPRRRRHRHRRSQPRGTPTSALTDGAIFTVTPRRGGRTALQVMLGELSINYLSCRRYQPDLQGRALPQTLKKAPAGPTRSGHRHRPATPYRRFPGLLQQHSPAPRAVPPARPSSVP